MTKFRLSPAAIRAFRLSLLKWFDNYKRDLPWRRNKDPYAIWVSEIMLQQTRVGAVLDHYANWMRRFPTVEVLAAATEEDVLAAWSGLGYYRRARFLHKGAKAVVTEHNHDIPRTASELLQLPGIGAYTSAAIASIAFGEPVAVVDGNVERVLLRQAGAAEAGLKLDKIGESSRIFLSAREIQEFATILIDPARPGDSNQAIMELGATVCLPRKPLCLQCPVQKTCRTRGEHPTASRKPILSEEIRFGLATREQRGVSEVLLKRRATEISVMPGMWELPPLRGFPIAREKPILALRHAIMQTNYRVGVFELSMDRASTANSNDDNRRWIKLLDLPALPLTGLARKIFVRLGLLLR
jgi:A/G-specific adenine glycosylase